MILEKRLFLPISLGRLKGDFQTVWSPSFYSEKGYLQVKITLQSLGQPLTPEYSKINL